MRSASIYAHTYIHTYTYTHALTRVRLCTVGHSLPKHQRGMCVAHVAAAASQTHEAAETKGVSSLVHTRVYVIIYARMYTR